MLMSEFVMIYNWLKLPTYKIQNFFFWHWKKVSIRNSETFAPFFSRHQFLSLPSTLTIINFRNVHRLRQMRYHKSRHFPYSFSCSHSCTFGLCSCRVFHVLWNIKRCIEAGSSYSCTHDGCFVVASFHFLPSDMDTWRASCSLLYIFVCRHWAILHCLVKWKMVWRSTIIIS